MWSSSSWVLLSMLVRADKSWSSMPNEELQIANGKPLQGRLLYNKIRSLSLFSSGANDFQMYPEWEIYLQEVSKDRKEV